MTEGELRELTKRHGILTICDEIQTGFGRTGALFASERLEIDYDIILTAKSMAGGLPISGITGRSEIMDTAQVGGLGGTFGGNLRGLKLQICQFLREITKLGKI